MLVGVVRCIGLRVRIRHSSAAVRKVKDFRANPLGNYCPKRKSREVIPTENKLPGCHRRIGHRGRGLHRRRLGLDRRLE